MGLTITIDSSFDSSYSIEDDFLLLVGRIFLGKTIAQIKSAKVIIPYAVNKRYLDSGYFDYVDQGQRVDVEKNLKSLTVDDLRTLVRVNPDYDYLGIDLSQKKNDLIKSIAAVLKPSDYPRQAVITQKGIDAIERHRTENGIKL